MLNQFSRTQLLYGAEMMGKLASSRVAVFGIGGVGGYVVEALARSGIGAIEQNEGIFRGLQLLFHQLWD
ncbi:ThiF family protein [Lachnospiraceae bacterium KH1T2]|nr:ThiF family protein [Lachnospiraceae bacterium KH1T2]